METSGYTALHSNVIFNRKERIYYEQFIKKVLFNR